MNTLNAIHWAALDSWWLVVLLSLTAGAILGYRLYKVSNSIARLNVLIAGQQFLMHASFIKYCAKAILWIIGFIFLCLALLRPQWDKKQEIVAQEGRDLFIALDISRSMLAQDLKPSRLEFAKRKIKNLVGALSCERVGLILFSGTSFISCPLTRDYGAFFLFLDQLDGASMSTGTTALDAPIAQATNAFESGSPRKHKLLVIVTDGEDFSPTLAATKEKARSLGLTVFALGIGTEQGGPIPLYDAQGKAIGHQKDKQSNVVISKLNEPLLQALTTDLGGHFLRASADNQDIKEFVARLNSFEKEKLEDRQIEHYQEQYPWFLMVSFSAFILEWIL